MFEQDVAGLIKALRANKNDEASVIHHALEETRKEIRSKDIEIKAAAVLKLVYVSLYPLPVSIQLILGTCIRTARDARPVYRIRVLCHRRMHVKHKIPHQDHRLPGRIPVL